MNLEQARNEYAQCFAQAAQCFKRALKEEKRNEPEQANYYWSKGIYWQGQTTRANLQKALGLHA